MDKKEMQELIAVKIQISKEEWKEEIGALQNEIHRLESIISSEEKKARQIDGFLQKFIKDNESRLMSLAHGNKSTTDVLKTSDDDTDALAILRTRVKSIISRTKIVIEERDLLFDDREKCFTALGVSSSNGNGNGDSKHMLSDIIRQKAKKDPGNEAKLRAELEEKEKVIQRLRNISAEYETEIDGNDSKVKGIKDDLAATTKENLELKTRMKQMEREMEDLRIKAATATNGNGNGKKTPRRGSKQ